MSVADLIAALVNVAHHVDDEIGFVRTAAGDLELRAGPRFVGAITVVYTEQGWARRHASRPS